jgi:hypothetical protein
MAVHLLSMLLASRRRGAAPGFATLECRAKKGLANASPDLDQKRAATVLEQPTGASCP